MKSLGVTHLNFQLRGKSHGVFPQLVRIFLAFFKLMRQTENCKPVKMMSVDGIFVLTY